MSGQRADLAESGARRGRRAIVTWAVFAVLFFLRTPCLAADLASAGPPCLFEVTVDRGLLTVDALAASLDLLLRTIAQQTGVHVLVDGDLNDLVTQSFRRLPLEEGIRRLTRGHSLSFVYTPGGGLGPAPLGAVHVYPGAWNRTGVRAARLRALDTLKARGDASALAALTRMLRQDHDPALRAHAATALGRLGSARAVTALTVALRDPAPAVRCRAVAALLSVRAEAAVDALRPILQSDPDPRLRRAVVRALGSLRIPDARRALQAARADPDASVRHEVTRVLTPHAPN
jgi:hypothetical protein